MGIYHYSNWDGRQDFPDLDKDRLLSELERNLTAYGDLTTALWKMQREGIEDSEGRHLGRVFFTSAQTLGRYLLMDFIARKSKVIQ